MDAERIAALSRLIDQALARPADEREAWLAALGPTHAALLPALRRALARIEAPSDAGDEPRPRLLDADAPMPVHIGPYRLLRPLGRGGMGEVWLAERADGAELPQLMRRVALKLPHAALLSDALRQRFARERDILAGLSHPHIARFLDAGVADGRPYLAMEWVDGQPITRHADAAGLTVAQRLGLFGQVLDAVEHAHQRLVAHRDLKPSNILVTAAGQAQLLDFGIAKLLDEDALGASTELTRLGGRALTPDYAAPEQLAGEPVTTAVDIYALGVVLYELLVGRHPFDGAARPATGEAPLASTRVAADLPDAGLRRRALRGDLDAILARALDPDPAQRYRSAAAFAADVQHVLRHEPVQARRIGWSARLAKFVHRHRAESALAAGLAASVVIGVISIAWAAERARGEARRAEQEAQHAQAESRRAESEAAREKETKAFLISLFKASDPRFASDQPRGAITARQLLDLGARRIEARFADDPDTRIELLGIVADIYGELDENERFGELLQRQIALALARYGELHPVTLGCLLRGADDAINRGEYAQAQARLDRVDGLLKRSGRDGGSERAYWWFLRAMALQAEPAARTERDQALAQAAALYAATAPDDSHHAFVLGAQGNLAHARGDEASAAELTRRSIAVAERAAERDDGALAVNYSNLGKTLAYLGDFAGAETAHARAVKLAEATYGRDAWPYWIAAASLAQAVHLGGDRERAAPLFEALLKVLPPPGHHFRNALEESAAARAREAIAGRLDAEGRPAQALPLYAAARVGFLHAPTYEYDLRQLRLETGVAEGDAGHGARAVALIQSALDEYVAKAPPGDAGRLRAREALARQFWRNGQAERAEHEWKQVLADTKDRALASAVLACDGLAELALRRRDGMAALGWVHRGQAMLDHLSGAHDMRLVPELGVAEARSLLSTGRAAEAQQAAQRAVDALRRYDAPGSTVLADAEATLRRARTAAGH